MIFSSMSQNQVTNPRSIITVIAPLLAKGGELKGNDEAISLLDHMKEATVLVQKVIYLNILSHTTNTQVLTTYLTSGGWDVLNTWLADTRKLDNLALAHEILKVLQHLPVTLDLLKQGNMGKVVKVFTKTEAKGESVAAVREAKGESVAAVKELSTELLAQWKEVVAREGSSSSKKKKSKDEDGGGKEISKKDQLVPKKDSSSKSTHIAESGGFLDAITQKAPQPRKVRKRNSGDDFKRSVSETKEEKKPEPLKVEKIPDPPSPPDERATICLTNSPPPLPEKSHGNDNMFSFRKAKKRRRIRWRDTIGGEEGLEEIQYFECDETERSNVTGGNFNDIAQKEHEMEKLGMLRSRQLGDDMMVELLDYKHPLPLDDPRYRAELGANSKERAIQKERERNALAFLMLDPHNVPDSPLEPDPELEITVEEPKIIPLVDIQEAENNQPVSTPSPQQPPDNGLSLPPALANILATPTEPLPETSPRHPTLEPPPLPVTPEFPAQIQRYPTPPGFPLPYNPTDFSYAPFAPVPPPNPEYRDYNRDERSHRDDRYRDERHRGDRYDRRDGRDRYYRGGGGRRGRGKTNRVCLYHTLPRGCKLGDKCDFLHVDPSSNGRERERDSTYT